MVKLEYFIIQVNRENAIYFPAEEVSGNVLIKSIERAKINAILLGIDGEAHVKWNEHESNTHGKSEWKTYSNRHTILQARQYLLLQNQTPTNELYLEAMEYNFPFRFVLPSFNLPTSFEHREAYIRYSLTAAIDIPWSFSIQTSRYFTVISTVDLNLIPGLRQSYGLSDIKTVCCGPCESDPITIQFNTNKTGFVPGESIKFNVSIDNRSSETIKSVSVALIQHTKFFSKGIRSRSHLNNILMLRYNGPTIGPGTKGDWSNAEFKIPIVCPSLLNMCPIITLDYTFTLVVSVNKGLSLNKVLQIPIVIGTVPLNDANITLPAIDYYSPIVNEGQNGSEVKMQENAPALITSNSNAVENHGNQTIQNFTPSYPYYKDFSV